MTASPRDTWSNRRRHALRAVGLGAALLSGVQCSDTPTASHPQIQLAHRASLAIAPSFASLPSGAPNIPLSKIRGVLQGAGGDSTVTEALFQGDKAILVFTVSFSGNTGTFALALTAYDTSGTAVYFTRTTIEVKPGDNPPVAPPPLQYSGPDASVAKLQISPNPVIMATGATAGLSVVGLTSTGASLPTPPRVGWTSRNPTIVNVDATGLLTAGALDGQTYVVARTATNVADSVLVTVKAQITTFTVTPTPATVAAGDTAIQLAAHLQDASGHPIVRTVTWSVDHPEIATVSAAGKLQGVKRGSATVTATVEDKTVTVPVTVTSAVDHVALSPATLSFTALGQTQSLTVTVVPHGAAPVSGIPVNVGIDNSDVATVVAGATPGTYVVTAKKVGTATITATADVASATAGVTVTQVAKTLVISPKTFSSSAQGDAKQFTATVADANGNAMPASAVTWASDNAGVVSVDKTGLAMTVNDGTAHVIAASGALADSATVTVKRVAVRLSITTPKDTIKPGELMMTTAAVVDANGHPFPTAITWSSSNPSVFTVGQDGSVTGVAVGQAFLQASGGGMSSGRQVTVANSGGVGGLGGEIISINDIDQFRTDYLRYRQAPGGARYDNYRFYLNVVDYTGSGPRASQKKVLWYTGHSDACYGCDGHTIPDTLTAHGYTVVYQNSSPITITSDVKVVFLFLPTTYFSSDEINAFRSLLADGGRIVFVGEHPGYYYTGRPIQNDFFAQLGAAVRMTTTYAACNQPAPVTITDITSHQTTTGVTTLLADCAAKFDVGGSDIVLGRDAAGYPTFVLTRPNSAPPVSILGSRARLTPSLSRSAQGTTPTRDQAPQRSPAANNPALTAAPTP